eukprot:7589558-Pyramimonas_sp.AAC.1
MLSPNASCAPASDAHRAVEEPSRQSAYLHHMGVIRCNVHAHSPGHGRLPCTAKTIRILPLQFLGPGASLRPPALHYHLL